MADHNYFANLIWQIADLLRGPYRPPQYERVMLPMTVLRRFDCVLAPTKAKVCAEFERSKDKFKGEALDARLNKAAGQRFHNHSPLEFAKLKGDPDNINKHLVSYIKGFSENVQRIFEYFEFETEIEKMHEANILYLVVSNFADVDLHPSSVPNEQMGLIFENLIRRFNELANETAGDHFTPREVIRLMVNLLFIHDDKLLATAGTVRKLLDPACGTGGMLAEAQRYLREHHSEAKLYVYGQDYNKRAFATAASDMLMKEVSHNGGGNNVRFGDIFTEDQFQAETFDYFLSNPPFGVDWKKQQKEIEKEHEKRGFEGRFGAGLPRVNDGALLFLQHMWSKREDVKPSEHKEGSRLAIVFSGSPMFTGGAGSGESEIRKWLLENDWLEAIVALPESMFYNTGIGTYVWVVTNRKEKRRKGKVQLLDARDVWTAGGSEDSKRSLGDKRRHMTVAQIDKIVRVYGKFEEGPRSKIFDNADFGYTRVAIERPLRLRYHMSTDDKARFLDACPHTLGDVQAIDKALGREPFRSVFTLRDAKAEPVAAGGRGSGFEAGSGTTKAARLRSSRWSFPATTNCGQFVCSWRPPEPRGRDTTTSSSTRPGVARATRSRGSRIGWRRCTTPPINACSTASSSSPTASFLTSSSKTTSISSSTSGASCRRSTKAHASSLKRSKVRSRSSSPRCRSSPSCRGSSLSWPTIAVSRGPESSSRGVAP
jgi:type I restriction enzyme M protein